MLVDLILLLLSFSAQTFAQVYGLGHLAERLQARNNPLETDLPMSQSFQSSHYMHPRTIITPADFERLKEKLFLTELQLLKVSRRLEILERVVYNDENTRLQGAGTSPIWYPPQDSGNMATGTGPITVPATWPIKSSKRFSQTPDKLHSIPVHEPGMRKIPAMFHEPFPRPWVAPGSQPPIRSPRVVRTEPFVTRSGTTPTVKTENPKGQPRAAAPLRVRPARPAKAGAGPLDKPKSATPSWPIAAQPPMLRAAERPASRPGAPHPPRTAPSLKRESAQQMRPKPATPAKRNAAMPPATRSAASSLRPKVRAAARRNAVIPQKPASKRAAPPAARIAARPQMRQGLSPKAKAVAVPSRNKTPPRRPIGAVLPKPKAAPSLPKPTTPTVTKGKLVGSLKIRTAPSSNAKPALQPKPRVPSKSISASPPKSQISSRGKANFPPLSKASVRPGSVTAATKKPTAVEPPKTKAAEVSSV